MAKTKIKSDIHGLYVKTDGRVYRPVASTNSYYISHTLNSREDGTSAFVKGQEVNAHHRSQTPFAVVKADGVEEYWHSHGEYIGRPTDMCWAPK